MELTLKQTAEWNLVCTWGKQHALIITAIHFLTLLITRYNEDCFHSSGISFLFQVELIHFGTGNWLWAGRSGVRIRTKVRDLSVSHRPVRLLGVTLNLCLQPKSRRRKIIRLLSLCDFMAWTATTLPLNFMDLRTYCLTS